MDNRRNHFRVSSLVKFQLTSISEQDCSYERLNELADKNHYLLNQLDKVRNENNQALKLIDDGYRDVATYLKGTDTQIEILAQIVLSRQFERLTMCNQCIISPDAIAIPTEGQYPLDSHFFIEMVLLPQWLYVPAIAKVVRTDEQMDKHITVLQFQYINDFDSDKIGKHVRLIEAEMRRSNL